MKKKFLLFAVLLLCLIAGIAAYVNDYYPADDTAVAVLQSNVVQSDLDKNTITVSSQNGMVVFMPKEADCGLIFYPGGKVEYTAYVPLLYQCAAQGIACILVEMPGNLAVLNKNAADGIVDQFPQINRWYLGGHSLGGAMAASYLAEHTDQYEGIVLLASYATVPIQNETVLSIYGTEDKVLNMEKYETNRANLPVDATELVIEGGCHAYFGSYGEQDGDGTAIITPEEQQEQTALAIAAFVKI